MRHRAKSRHPSLTGSRPMAGLAVLIAMTALGTGSCSGEPVATVSPPSTSAPSIAASPTQPVKAVYLARSVPIRLQIESIGVDSGLMELGLKPDGTLQVPPSGFPAGWYTGMPTPGERGPAIIVGHVDWKGPGVFYNLHKLKPGELVAVTRTDGSKPVFRVTRVQQFPKNQFPTKAVYGNIENAGLRLITCGGTFNAQTGHYEDNLVVFADLVAPAK